MTTNDKTDVRSEPSTIAALRQGVAIDQRYQTHEIKDHRGEVHDLPFVLTERRDGAVSIVSVELAKDALAEVDKRATGPRRRAGLVQLDSLGSLIDYVNRFKRPETVAFAPNDPQSVTVVFDYYPGGASGTAWREDRALYTCPTSREWSLWHEEADEPMGQVAFGDFIEANADDLGPGGDGFVSAPDLLKVARELAIHTKGTFERKVNPTTGEGTLVVKDEHDTSSTKIPRAFRLAIPVFEGGDTYAVEARIRFAMGEGGRPQFTYTLHNDSKVMEHALNELRARIAAECGIPVYVGQAPAGGAR